MADQAADRNHLRDSRHGQKPSPHGPVGGGARLHEPVHRRAHADQQNLAHDRTDRGEHRSAHVLGELGDRELQPLVDGLAGAEDVRAPLEVHPDDADALGRARPHPADPGRPVHGGLDREGDQALDLFGRQPVGIAQHGDGRRGEVGEDIDGERGGDPAAPRQQHDGGAQREEAVLQGGADQRVQDTGAPGSVHARAFNAGGRGRKSRRRRQRRASPGRRRP